MEDAEVRGGEEREKSQKKGLQTSRRGKKAAPTDGGVAEKSGGGHPDPGPMSTRKLGTRERPQGEKTEQE